MIKDIIAPIKYPLDEVIPMDEVFTIKINVFIVRFY